MSISHELSLTQRRFVYVRRPADTGSSGSLPLFLFSASGVTKPALLHRIPPPRNEDDRANNRRQGKRRKKGETVSRRELFGLYAAADDDDDDDLVPLYKTNDGDGEGSKRRRRISKISL